MRDDPLHRYVRCRRCGALHRWGELCPGGCEQRDPNTSGKTLIEICGAPPMRVAHGATCTADGEPHPCHCRGGKTHPCNCYESPIPRPRKGALS